MPACKYCRAPAIGEIPAGARSGLPPVPVCSQHGKRAGVVDPYRDDRNDPRPVVDGRYIVTGNASPPSSTLSSNGSQRARYLAGDPTVRIADASPLARQVMADYADALPPADPMEIMQLLEETNQMPTANIIDQIPVPSESNPRTKYTVTVDSEGGATCDCMDYVMKGIRQQNLAYRCKHIRAVIVRQDVQDKIAAAQGPAPRVRVRGAKPEEDKPIVHRRRGQNIDL